MNEHTVAVASFSSQSIVDEKVLFLLGYSTIDQNRRHQLKQCDTMMNYFEPLQASGERTYPHNSLLGTIKCMRGTIGCITTLA